MKPYNPTLTPAEQARKASYEEWELKGNYWVNVKTGQQEMFHPIAMQMGEHIYKAAKRFIPPKKR